MVCATSYCFKEYSADGYEITLAKGKNNGKPN